jgi:phosphatidylinositol-3-phosphatase
MNSTATISAFLTALAAFSAGAQTATPTGLRQVKTVFLILMENHDWSTILGSPNCPYINNTLLPRASYCNNYRTPPGNHPSEPNYLWLVAGTNFGILNDNPPANNHQGSTNTLFHQMDRASLSWRTYQEDITGTTVPDVNNGEYAVRHNPFVFFDSVRNNLAYCTNHVRPYSQLARDLTNNSVARFNFISPNLTNDMHDLCPGMTSTRVQGDNWLAREVPKILASPAYTNDGALFIVFDEGSNDSDGPLAMIMLSPLAKAGGYNNAMAYDHSSALRTFQDIFGLRPYLGGAANATSLGDLFVNVPQVSIHRQTTGFALTLTNTIAGKTNLLKMATTLPASSWTTLQTNVANGISLNLTDNTAAGNSRRFYRVVELP